jgi:hypothetical protein
MVRRTILLIAVPFFLVAVMNCALKKQDAGKNEQHKNNFENISSGPMLSELRQVLTDCIRDSRMYFSIDALKQKDKIQQLAAQLNAPFWAELSPLQNFFVFEIVPALKQKAETSTLAAAYCSAIRELTPDWWGLPGGTPTKTLQNVLKEKELDTCLITLLTDNTSLRYLDGEANTISDINKWTVSDLAAGILANEHRISFDADAPEAQRATIKQQLKSSIQNNKP